MGHLANTDQAVTEGATPPRVDRPKNLHRRRSGLVQIFPRDTAEAPITWEVAREGVVGRSSTCAWPIHDPKVSREHARLYPRDGGFTVQDLGSRNGTYVNGVPVASGGDAFLPFGAVLRLANTLLLAAEDAQAHAGAPRVLPADKAGTRGDVVAGPALAAVWDHAARVARDAHPVLVVGENGSGKEVLARLIHAAGYANKPLVARNVGAIPEGLFESELFGHARGSFTSAVQSRLGAFRSAHHGVLFLDEIADLRLDHQVKLLRALDEGRVVPVGEDRPVDVDVRVVAATNKDLRELVLAGRFREDLYYRLATVTIRVPPLRERRDEVLLLALRMLAVETVNATFSADTAEALALAPWPGNVRNLLRVVLEAARHAADDRRHVIEPSDLPELVPLERVTVLESGEMTVEKLRAAVLRASGVIRRAASDLGISRST
ncbi:MAG: sigma 54-interacting transcriptional regulator, partial [Myxococcota bacterium]